MMTVTSMIYKLLLTINYNVLLNMYQIEIYRGYFSFYCKVHNYLDINVITM